MERDVKQASQRPELARKRAAPPAKSSAARFGDLAAEPEGAGVAPDSLDPKILRSEYERAGQQLRAWLWAGLSLLLLGFGLWRWGPRERLAETVPVAARGYAFRQAGAVRGPGGATWLWILADTAGQAQVLLSADHGRTWRARALGVPSYRARALALGWGAPGRGLIVGDSGWVRMVADVFNNPTQGQNHQLAGISSAALRSVAVDTMGQEAVLTEANGGVWATLNQGRTWTLQRLSATRMIQPDAGIIAAYWPHRGSFLLVSPQRIGELQPASKAMEVDMRAWAGWSDEPRIDTVAALAFDFNQEQEHDNVLFMARNGQALYSWRVEGREPAATSHASLRLFGPGVRAVALASWPAGRPDSALLLTHKPAGGQLQRIAIRPQLSAAVARVEQAYAKGAIAAPPPRKQLDGFGSKSGKKIAQQAKKAEVTVASRKPVSGKQRPAAGGQQQGVAEPTVPTAQEGNEQGGNERGGNEQGQTGKNAYKAEDVPYEKGDVIANKANKSSTAEKYPAAQQTQQFQQAPNRPKQRDTLNTMKVKARPKSSSDYKKN